MPAAHRAHLEWTPQRLIHWGQQIGAATGVLVTRLLQEQRHPEHGYRACLGLLSLSRRYGRERLEATCALALELGVHRSDYQSLAPAKSSCGIRVSNSGHHVRPH